MKAMKKKKQSTKSNNRIQLVRRKDKNKKKMAKIANKYRLVGSTNIK